MDESARARILDRFLGWAASQPSIRAVALVGSQAREDHPADEWSDIDVVVVAANARSLLESMEWASIIAAPWFSITEKSASGETIERRILFEGCIDVDFIIVSAECALAGFPGTFVGEIAARGARVLIDKDGILSSFPRQARPVSARTPPSSREFLEVVEDFWFHAAWTAKKLNRGELWVGKRCCDEYMKRLLLRMVEWHARLVGDGLKDTWFDGRFLEQWASPGVVEELRKAFARYDVEDVWDALSASMDIFHRIALETAGRLGCGYPAENAVRVSEWVRGSRRLARR